MAWYTKKMGKVCMLALLLAALVLRAEEPQSQADFHDLGNDSDSVFCLTLPVLQVGVAAISEDLYGLQLGFGTFSKDLSGVQMGALARTDESINGIQIGLFFAAARSAVGWQHSFFFSSIGGGPTDIRKIGLANAPKTPWAYGLQTAFIGGFVDRFGGVQISFMGNTAFEIRGLQLAMFGASAGEVKGLQAAILPSAKSMVGIQIGCFNETEELHGLQLGLWNRAKSGAGVQIGIVNGFGPEGHVLWLPLVNARF